MINLLLFLFAITGIAIGAAWFAEHPGSVTIYWFDWRIDTSFAFLFLLVLIAAFLIASIWVLIRKIIHFPTQYRQKRQIRYYTRGLSELTYSVAALAAADAKGAMLHTRKAERLLGKTPLTLMLSAQVAKSQGDEEKTRTLLAQMLEHKETEYLAARSLSDAASKQQHFTQAVALAQRAYDIGPKDTAAVAAMVGLYLRSNQWQPALDAIRKAARTATVSATTLQRLKGMVHIKRGQQLLADGRSEEAFVHAKLGLRSLPDFIPATTLAARAYHAQGHDWWAQRILLKGWKKRQHPDIADTLEEITARLPESKRQQIMKKLAATAPLPVPSDAHWNCTSCHRASDRWDTHCPACDAFDTVVWK